MKFEKFTIDYSKTEAKIGRQKRTYLDLELKILESHLTFDKKLKNFMTITKMI